MTKPDWWDTACSHLARDSIMAQLIDSYQGEVMRQRNDAFTTLVRSIIGQQISVLAAASVMQRVEQGLQPLTPSVMLASDEANLRGFGLSQSKARYLRAVAEFCLNPPDWQADQLKLKQSLLALPGIGEWTWQMFAIFYLQLPDEFPLRDLGLRKALRINYQLIDDAAIDSAAMQQRIAGFSPWRTAATWYLWRSIDPQPVNY